MRAFYLGRCFFTQSFRQSRIPLKANRPVLIQDYVWKWKIRSDRRTAKVGNLAKGQSRLCLWWLRPSVSRLMHWVLASYSPFLQLPLGRGRSASHPWSRGWAYRMVVQSWKRCLLCEWQHNISMFPLACRGAVWGTPRTRISVPVPSPTHRGCSPACHRPSCSCTGKENTGVTCCLLRYLCHGSGCRSCYGWFLT